MSMKFPPAALIRTSACPSPGFGGEISSRIIASGPPYRRIRIAFILTSTGTGSLGLSGYRGLLRIFYMGKAGFNRHGMHYTDPRQWPRGSWIPPVSCRRRARMAKGSSFEGVFPILVTPFDEREEIDLESFTRVVRFMADIGVDGGTTRGGPGGKEGLRIFPAGGRRDPPSDRGAGPPRLHGSSHAGSLAAPAGERDPAGGVPQGGSSPHPDEDPRSRTGHDGAEGSRSHWTGGSLRDLRPGAGGQRGHDRFCLPGGPDRDRPGGAPGTNGGRLGTLPAFSPPDRLRAAARCGDPEGNLPDARPDPGPP